MGRTLAHSDSSRFATVLIPFLVKGKGHNARTLASIVFGLHRSIHNVTKGEPPRTKNKKASKRKQFSH